MTQFENNRCPICGAINLTYHEEQELGINIPAVRGGFVEFGGEVYCSGTACWDSDFGDECGKCLNSIINTETALIGPMGMCH